MRIFSLMLACFCLSNTINAKQFVSRTHWSQLESQQTHKVTRPHMPAKYITASCNIDLLKQELASAPMERTEDARINFTTIELPTPDGSFKTFKVWQTRIMHPDLAAAYPQIKTFAGVDINNPATSIYIDYSPLGFHAFIQSPQQSYYIDPVAVNDDMRYIIFNRKDITRSKDFVCGVDNTLELTEQIIPQSLTQVKIGGTLRTYRLALACTGEYASYFGSTIPVVLGAMIVSVNRIDGVYEKEVGISFELIPNDTLLIYFNSNTDPYSNNNGGAMLGENKANINAVIGANNYDIGHVFSTGGGGIASLACVCGSNKAQGVTGSGNPQGDPFDIDYVAHEVGHQFGGNHTFNSVTGACSGNRAPNAAYEPGSGVTIMGYAGICGSDDLASNSIPTMHTKTFDEMIAFAHNGNGNGCAVQSVTGNSEPVLTATGSWIIPFQTPFRLTASGTDTDNDTVYYSWEQYDLGPAGTWNNPSGNAPIYRSYNPDTNPTRLFPRLNYILTNTTGKGELKPSYARTMHFRCTLRDNRLGGGGVVRNSTAVAVEAINTGVGFAVTYPNVSGIVWAGNSQETITWNVAQSDLAPISTPLVNILLSTDGGYNFPISLASGIPNNGSYILTVPNNVSAATCRIMIEGAGNVFFDINDKNFSIAPAAINENLFETNFTCNPNPFTNQLIIKAFKAEDFEYQLCDLYGKVILQNIENQKLQSEINIKTDNLAKGVYQLILKQGSGIYVKRIEKNVKVNILTIKACKQKHAFLILGLFKIDKLYMLNIVVTNYECQS
ncbi:MAG: T9SS type A sorting domain-containing protein [Bacteroidetes bacterium]|nr:T9SS type A sorting domain-containing protein [Bacteroidota bacterium]